MTAYLTIDGVEKCEAPIGIRLLEAERAGVITAKELVNVTCSYKNREEAEKGAAILRCVLPDAKVEVHDGGCPVYAFRSWM